MYDRQNCHYLTMIVQHYEVIKKWNRIIFISVNVSLSIFFRQNEPGQITLAIRGLI